LEGMQLHGRRRNLISCWHFSTLHISMECQFMMCRILIAGSQILLLVPILSDLH
jgi:hypothetical protein